MRIGIDGLFACNNYGGLSIYSKQVIHHLLQIDAENEYLLFVEKESNVPVQPQSNLDIVALEKRPETTDFKDFYDARVVWDQEILSQAVEMSGIDLFFGPVFMAPLKRSCPAVITVHDLIFITHPEVYPVQTLGYYGVWGRLCAENAEGIVTISQDTARLLQERYTLPHEKISVTYAAAEESLKPADTTEDVSKIQEKYNFKPNYVLYVGGTFPARKNYQTLIRAYAQLPKEIRHKHQLVFLTGSKKGSGVRKMNEFFQAEGFSSEITEDIVVIDFVEREELTSFYQGATLFVYPSLYEGFGLPPLEAMCCGTPVVTTTAPAMSEIVAEYGMLVDPLDVTEMAQAMENVLTEPQLQDTLSQKGLRRAQDFSWTQTAKLTLQAFDQVMRSQ
ncbi:MAG: glycosyltransferase family 1 protein [Chloroflexota bacterium]